MRQVASVRAHQRGPSERVVTRTDPATAAALRKSRSCWRSLESPRPMRALAQASPAAISSPLGATIDDAYKTLGVIADGEMPGMARSSGWPTASRTPGPSSDHAQAGQRSHRPHRVERRHSVERQRRIPDQCVERRVVPTGPAGNVDLARLTGRPTHSGSPVYGSRSHSGRAAATMCSGTWSSGTGAARGGLGGGHPLPMRDGRGSIDMVPLVDARGTGEPPTTQAIWARSSPPIRANTGQFEANPRHLVPSWMSRNSAKISRWSPLRSGPTHISTVPALATGGPRVLAMMKIPTARPSQQQGKSGEQHQGHRRERLQHVLAPDPVPEAPPEPGAAAPAPPCPDAGPTPLRRTRAGMGTSRAGTPRMFRWIRRSFSKS